MLLRRGPTRLNLLQLVRIRNISPGQMAGLPSAGFAALAAGLSLLLREAAPVKTGPAVS